MDGEALLQRLGDRLERCPRAADAQCRHGQDHLVPRRRSGRAAVPAGRRRGSRRIPARRCPRRSRCCRSASAPTSWCATAAFPASSSAFRPRASARSSGSARRTLRAGAAIPDKRLAAAALEAGLGGFHFYHGIPGGHRRRAAHECRRQRRRDARAGRRGARASTARAQCHVLTNAEMGYAYRHSGGAARPDLHLAPSSRAIRPTRPRSARRWTRSSITARRCSRSARRPAARPSRTRRAVRPGRRSTRPAAAGCGSAARRCPKCTATS